MRCFDAGTRCNHMTLCVSRRILCSVLYIHSCQVFLIVLRHAAWRPGFEATPLSHYLWLKSIIENSVHFHECESRLMSFRNRSGEKSDHFFQKVGEAWLLEARLLSIKGPHSLEGKVYSGTYAMLLVSGIKEPTIMQRARRHFGAGQ